GPSRIPVVGPEGRELSDADRDAVLGLLSETWLAHHTVILAGRGAVRSDAHDALVRLAEATGAVLATTIMAKGYFAGSPYDIGVVGTLALPPAIEVLSRADLVRACGASAT